MRPLQKLAANENGGRNRRFLTREKLACAGWLYPAAIRTLGTLAKRLVATDTDSAHPQSMPSIGPGDILLLLVLSPLAGIPAYVVGLRRDVAQPGLAFIPFVGPWIAVLRSIGTSGWGAVLACIPLVGIVFAIWAAFTIPSRHGRTELWGVWFMVPLVNLVGFWFYAFTLQPV